MPSLLPQVDPGGLLEYSVVYTDRAVNHMSKSFQSVMNDISGMLKEVYSAKAAVVVPGSGTFAMEAVARQFATQQHCLVIRNGWFSFRWTQILEMGSIAEKTTVLQARQIADEAQAPFAPVDLDEVVSVIKAEKPACVFAPHVETSAGMMLPNAYLKAVAEAVHSYGGLFILDCIASGAMWVDMEACGVDVLISAPQKGWSGSPCCGLVMLSDAAVKATKNSQSTSFSCDLGKWLDIMQAYESGGHAYHATMPTDALHVFRDVMKETQDFGFAKAATAQQELGRGIRDLLESQGYISVAAPGFQAPGVVVSYTNDAAISNGSKFAAHGIQIAAGVPLQCGERDDFSTFRIGLFGLDKLKNVPRTIEHLANVLPDLA